MRVRLGDTVVRTRQVTLTAERAEGDDMDMRVSGLGVPYETWTTLYDSTTSIREIMSRGCFKASLKDSSIDVMSCRGHNRENILARLSNGTLTLKDRTDGLYFTATLNPEDPFARSLYAQVKRQDVRGASIRFEVGDDDGWETKEFKKDGKWHYEDRIKRGILRAVDPVSDPAYPTTTASVRQRERAAADYDAFLRAIRMPGDSR